MRRASTWGTAVSGKPTSSQFPPEAASQNPAGYRYSLSTSRWRYDREERRLQMPDGTVCEYDAPTGATTWRLTSCSDPYGRFLAVSYDGNETRVRQILQGADPENPDQKRDVVFPTYCFSVCTMTYGTRVWTLTLGGTEGIRFRSPGVAAEWLFEFASAAPAPTRITTPGGGIIEYQYQEYLWNEEEPASPENSRGWFPVSRTTSGSIPAGEWSFNVSFSVPTIQPNALSACP